MRPDPDAVAHWDAIRAEYASGERRFTEIKPQPLAHERADALDKENKRLRALLEKTQ